MISYKSIGRLRQKLFMRFIEKKFAYVGQNCSVHHSVIYRNPDKIYLSGDNTIKEYVIMDGRSDREIGIFLGKGVTIRSYTYIDCYGSQGQIYLDDYSSIGQHIILGGNGGIYIGKFVMISGLTYIVSATHLYDIRNPVPYRYQGEVRRPVVIKDNAWVASHCMILNGVTIGENSVIGAGSVVVNDIPPNSLAFGVPAKVHRTLNGNEFSNIHKEEIHHYVSEEVRDKMALVRRQISPHSLFLQGEEHE